MENWEENVVERTSFGLVKLAEAATAVSLREYAVLAFALAIVWLYRTLECHFVEDLLRGFRGEVPFLHYNSTSKVAEHIVAKCKTLRRRFCVTPWLSSPHIQMAFLHFKGNPPEVEYHREVYIAHDDGTIALDWVKPPTVEDENGIATDRKLKDESPIVFIVPGLVSESTDPYVKHIAYSCATRGWRTLVVNHRGLGGVSITSEQFYNAGWTEDLRTIINDIHSKYPQAPVFAIGTSMGANLLVKYLGEEGASSHVSAAAVVNCPWDLLICNRFLFRKGIQRIYNRVLASGLVHYLSLHQIAIGQIAEWAEITKSKTLYDVDHHFTRHTGKYETVDTYYRRTCSADYVTRVAVPLLCFSALDDPICTKEAIPWDEVRANPNVIMVVTRHGSHLAYTEGLTAKSLWWVRAVTDYMTVMLSSNLMHTRQKATSRALKNTEDVGNDPSSSQIAEEGPRLLSLESSASSSKEEEDDASRAATKAETSDESSNEGAAVTLTFTKSLELIALQSALSQLLSQIQASRPVTMKSERNNLSSEDDSMTTSTEASVDQLKQSALASLKGPLQVSVNSSFKRFGKETAAISCNGTVTTKNRRTLWLLTYIAIATTCPVIGAAIFTRWRGTFKNLTKNLRLK